MQMRQFPVCAWFDSANEYGSIEQPEERSSFEIAQAEDWLKSCGAKRVYAPLGRSTWLPYRATCSPIQSPLFYGETNFDPRVWVDAGYQIAARYHSSLAQNGEQIRVSSRRKKLLERQGWTIDNYDNSMPERLKRCHEIANRAFRSAFCFQSISWNDFRSMYQPLLQKLDPRLVLLALSPEGDVAGFCLSYPDFQNPKSKRFVLKTLAVDPQYAGQGIGSWLTGEAHSRAEELGLSGGGIHAYMWTGSYSQQISGHVGVVIRDYVLFEKQF